MTTERQADATTMFDVVKALTRPLRTDRAVPPAPGTPAEAFEALYARRPDPWGVLSSPLAQYRYLALVEAVADYGPCRSMLDVGCGEGALTRYSSEAPRPSSGSTAVRRRSPARGRASRKRRSRAARSRRDTARESFDLVLAVEVLYYVSNPQAAIEQLLSLGRSVIVSYHDSRAPAPRALSRCVLPKRRPPVPSLLRAAAPRVHDRTARRAGARSGT